MIFDKSHGYFPIKKSGIYLSHCGISPLYSEATETAIELIREQALYGGTHFMDFYDPKLNALKEEAGRLLGTSGQNIATVHNSGQSEHLIPGKVNSWTRCSA